MDAAQQSGSKQCWMFAQEFLIRARALGVEAELDNMKMAFQWQQMKPRDLEAVNFCH